LHNLITKHLKLKVSYSKQTGSAVKTVFSKVHHKWLAILLSIAYAHQAKAQYPCFEGQEETLGNMLKQQLKKASKVRKINISLRLSSLSVDEGLSTPLIGTTHGALGISLLHIFTLLDDIQWLHILKVILHMIWNISAPQIV